MKNYFDERPNGYLETIEKGLAAVRSFDLRASRGEGGRAEQLARLKNALDSADAVVVGAGAGLSTAAGFTYSGERFEKNFFDFEEAFGFHDMYTGGFVVMRARPETAWAYWARHIYFNRYVDAPRSVYADLLSLVEDKDYFVITTNVDHQFQRAGFDEKRLFCTQGDYGLFQAKDGGLKETFGNEEWTYRALEAQGFVKDENGVYDVPDGGSLKMSIPTELIPKTPDGGDVAMNLRSDDTFVEDAAWRRASAAYSDFLRRHDGLRVLYLEIGVGGNTPVIIKYPFWCMTKKNANATYACLNYGEAYCPREIEKQSICVDGDTADALEYLVRG